MTQNLKNAQGETHAKIIRDLFSRTTIVLLLSTTKTTTTTATGLQNFPNRFLGNGREIEFDDQCDQI